MQNKIKDGLSRNPFEKPLNTAEVLDMPMFHVQKERIVEVTAGSEVKDINIVQLQSVSKECLYILRDEDKKPDFILRKGILFKIRTISDI